MSITLSREEGRELLNLLEYFNQFSLPPHGIAIPAEIDDLMDTLRARLSEPENEWAANELQIKMAIQRSGFSLVKTGAGRYELWKFGDIVAKGVNT